MNESKRPIDGLTYTRAEWEAVKHKDALHQKGIFCPLMEKVYLKVDLVNDKETKVCDEEEKSDRVF